MSYRDLGVAAVSAVAIVSSPLTASAEPIPMEYVCVCDAFGEGYYFIPGTETCVNANTGATRLITADGIVDGSTELKSLVDEIEQRLDSAFFDLDRKLHEEASIAAALADPDLVAGEHFGIRVNWGNAGSANAFGFSGAAVLGEGLFGKTGRLTGSAGLGFSGKTVGGRAGLQLTW